MEKKKLLVIGGPTAVGKSDLSVSLAKKLNGEIISADSMQIYKYMDVGSAKISKEEMEGIPHYMVDIINPNEEFSVSEFKERCKDIIDDIHSRGKLPIICGGTGLYISSIVCNMSFTESAKDDEYRDYLWNLAKEHGNEYLHKMLEEVDLESAKNIHANNVKRVIRALEVYKLTGKPFSDYKEDEQELYNIPYDLYYYVLNIDRAKLYKRINYRVDKMMDMGLLEEVKVLQSMGYDDSYTSMKGIGYKEMLYYLDNKIDLDKAIDMIKQGSRNYAKRQITWFKKDKRVKWIEKDSFKNEEEIVSKIINDINN